MQAQIMSPTGLALVKHFEGLHLESYLCPAKKVTIGYGHTGEIDGDILELGTSISEFVADHLLAEDMQVFETAVRLYVRVDLSQQQFDALVSFAFNCGANNLRTSTLLRLLNAGNYDAVPAQLQRWTKAHTDKGFVDLPGLVRRRKAEAHLWTTGELKFHFDEEKN